MFFIFFLLFESQQTMDRVKNTTVDNVQIIVQFDLCKWATSSYGWVQNFDLQWYKHTHQEKCSKYLKNKLENWHSIQTEKNKTHQFNTNMILTTCTRIQHLQYTYYSIAAECEHSGHLGWARWSGLKFKHLHGVRAKKNEHHINFNIQIYNKACEWASEIPWNVK